MPFPIFRCLFLLLFSGSVFAQAPVDTASLDGQEELPLLSLEPATHFSKKRFWTCAGTGAAVYTGVSVALWKAWYANYPRGRFHTFNDMGEWRGMDKSGHTFSAFIEANYAAQGARWTGMERRKAMWVGVGVGMGLQATIEVMDGFSEQWGFSWGDVAFNTLGVSMFAVQDLLWEEQRIIFKASGARPDYSTNPIFSLDGGHQTTLDERAAELYGTSAFEVILKDYNALTVWGSVNVHSFLPEKQAGRLPGWLNLAVGYGAENIYGGFGNKWQSEDGVDYLLDDKTYPRYSQFFLSPDIDLTRIPTRHRWLKFALGVLNWVKVPAPALEINTMGQTKFHPFYW